VVVLAGGASRRFGRDKLRTPIRGSTAITRVLDRAAPIADRLTVAVASGAQQRALSRHVPPSVDWSIDRVDAWGTGPGAAIGRTLEMSPRTPTLFLPGDIPWLQTAALRRFLERSEAASASVVVPAWDSGETENLIQFHRDSEAVAAVPSAALDRPAGVRATEFLRAAPTTLIVPISQLTQTPRTFSHLTYPTDLRAPAARGVLDGSRALSTVRGVPKRAYSAAYACRARHEDTRARHAFRREARWYAAAGLPGLSAHATEDADATINRTRRLRGSS
jgi:molybdopterin-guanine dinucleotide biosynthesis protein A